ncbi:MAG: phosphoenolpyruvate--protein phosphotransferase [Pontiellaceae bacterium]
MSLKEETLLKGIGVSPGIVIASARVLIPDVSRVSSRTIKASDVSHEQERFRMALKETREQLLHIRKQVMEVLDEQHARIFDAHMLVVEDELLVREVEQAVEVEQTNVEPLLQRIASSYADKLAGLEDQYLAGRATDIRDVTRRILANLAEEAVESLRDIESPCVLVTTDLLPSDTAGLDAKKVQAFITDLGSANSHTAIMARALNVPAVVGLRIATSAIHPDDLLLVDGAKGVVFIRPSQERLADYAERARHQAVIRQELDLLRDKPPETLDGYHVPLTANIELLEELDGVDAGGAKGVGLYRTEFLFLGSDALPNEDEQTAAYTKAAQSQYPAPVVIRTLDLGADKMPSWMEGRREMNPFLGLRAIRLCLDQPELFCVQLRAILRASVHKNVRVMYPMVTGVVEVKEANVLLHQCMDELTEKGIPFNREIEVGTMIEVPSAALVADKIAPHVRFFSLGTNDLIQYSMAVDRGNEDVAHLYQPTNLAVIRLIDHVVKVCRRFGLWSTICGQMASTPHLVPLLVGLGVDELSVSPLQAPLIKDVIRKLYYADAVELAQRALISDTSEEIEAHCVNMIVDVAPEVLALTE